MADIHIYIKSRYLRTLRNVKPGGLIDIEGDPQNYTICPIPSSIPDSTGNDHEPLPDTRWPEGSEL